VEGRKIQELKERQEMDTNPSQRAGGGELLCAGKNGFNPIVTKHFQLAALLAAPLMAPLMALALIG
jgi:hypothetical protein